MDCSDLGGPWVTTLAHGWRRNPVTLFHRDGTRLHIDPGLCPALEADRERNPDKGWNQTLFTGRPGLLMAGTRPLCRKCALEPVLLRAAGQLSRCSGRCSSPSARVHLQRGPATG